MTLVVDNTAPSGGGTTRRSYYRRRRYGRYSYGRYGRYGRRYRRRRRTVRSSVKRMRRAYMKKLSKFALANIDPFNVDATGAKIPDSNTCPSHAFRVDDSWPATSSDANGLKAFAFLPTLKNTVVNHTAATSSSWTWTAGYGGAADSSRLTAIASQYSLFRPVAHGIRITCPGAPTSVTGNLHVAVVANSEWGATTWGFPTSIAQLSNSLFYKKYPLAQFTQQGVTVVNKFIDTTATRYIDPNSDGIGPTTNDNNFQTNGWCAILVVVEGAPGASVVMEIEEVIHAECIPKKDGISTATPAAAFDVKNLETVSRMAGETSAAFADTDRREYMQEVASALRSGARGAAERVFSNVVLPTAYAFGGYAVNRALGLPGVTNYRNPSAFGD